MAEYDTWPVYGPEEKPWYEDVLPSNKTATDFAGNLAQGAAQGGAGGDKGLKGLAIDIGKGMAISKGISYAKDKIGGWLSPAAATEVASPLAGGAAETILPDVAAGAAATPTAAAGGAAPGLLASAAPVAIPAAAFLLASVLFSKIGSGGGKQNKPWQKEWKKARDKEVYGDVSKGGG